MAVKINDFIEVSKPRIVIVLVITAITTALAATRYDSTPQYGWDIEYSKLLILGIAGALASMGSSALNHYLDRDIDIVMTRTRTRPIPSGRLSPRSVLIFGIVLCGLSLFISLIAINIVTTSMIAIGILFYVVVYTLWLKRSNVSNIVIGGFAGSAASMAGWSTTTGSLDALCGRRRIFGAWQLRQGKNMPVLMYPCCRY
jgi:protoheme IX farnesyltransferase